MIILVGGEKGGSGKSCLAQNIAVYLKQKGRDIKIVDADPQGTTIFWIKEREANEDVENIPAEIATGNIRETLKALSEKHQDIIVDAGGQDSEALRSAMTVATHMLIPFRPKRRDLRTLINMEEMIKLAKTVNFDLIVNAVITQCPSLPSQAPRILEAKEVCTSFGIEPLNSITTTRNIYDDADENGISVLETKADKKAAHEIISIAEEFLKI
ncbi:AAA family ATPase [Zooshikella ganghwensis]|uniref:Chromosome partitioning protein ParA n=1 Tax=Zooshikella ganghwensis TaxID=202772 RepID=A0A4P9VH58_9GAMM|nr:AAA family ATPase [Zooshikella ganghwensis]RDH41729.1 chromosome partitioning protein ParA [Zooshikella ganghwensis]